MADNTSSASDFKTDRGDYDLFNITERLSDHITDEVFRHLIEGRDPDRDFGEGDLVSELDESLERRIKKDLIPSLTKTATRQIKDRLVNELNEQYHPESMFESVIDRSISGARWAMAVVYMLLAVSLFSILAYTMVDVAELSCTSALDIASFARLLSAEDVKAKKKAVCRYEAPVNTGKKSDSLDLVIAPTVKLLDLVLIGSLVVMVLIGGYENTVSRIGMRHSMPVWLGKLTISELKVKVSASIVIISSIHLLMEFLQLDFPDPAFLKASRADDIALTYYFPLLITSVVHLVFIFSAMAITYIGRLEAKHD